MNAPSVIESKTSSSASTTKFKKEDALVVVAIDFGTSFSGYAYSLRLKQNEERRVYCNQIWHSGEGGLSTLKTPTAILLKTNGDFVSFGYKAETEYFDLLETGNADVDEYCFFRGYKMTLYHTTDNPSVEMLKNIKIKDFRGKPMKAMTVISQTLQYLKEHFVKCAQASHFDFKDDDIHWVVTIPVIWKDVAKQFMIEAAKKAGLERDFVTLAYEPEAAAICCRETIVKMPASNVTEKMKLRAFEPGHKFIVLDCGGGTVDITTFEVLPGSTLKEVVKPCGGSWGGENVNKEYETFLSNLFGKDVWSKFTKSCSEDYLSVMNTFESKKRFTCDTRDITISFPISLVDIYHEITNKKFKSICEDNESMKELIEVKGVNKVRIKIDTMKTFFSNSITSILGKARQVTDLCKKEGHNISSILMVGGFSESPVLQTAIKAEFGEHNTVICPPDGSVVVMKGAVMFGQNPYLISERICPRTYGISVDTLFDDKKHPNSLRSFEGGRAICTDVFKTMVEEDTRLIVGKSDFEFICNPTCPDDTEVLIEVFESDHKFPMYTFDKGISKLGVLSVPLSHCNQTVKVKFYFGFTQLYVTAEVVGSDTKTEIQFECMFK